MKQGMKEYLKKYKDIDMVYCENDSEALGAINAIKQAGKKVGTDKLNLCTKRILHCRILFVLRALSCMTSVTCRCLFVFLLK